MQVEINWKNIERFWAHKDLVPQLSNLGEVSLSRWIYDMSKLLISGKIASFLEDLFPFRTFIINSCKYKEVLK